MGLPPKSRSFVEAGYGLGLLSIGMWIVMTGYNLEKASEVKG